MSECDRPRAPASGATCVLEGEGAPSQLRHVPHVVRRPDALTIVRRPDCIPYACRERAVCNRILAARPLA